MTIAWRYDKILELSHESDEKLKGFSIKKRVKVSKAQIDFWIANSQKAQKTFWKKVWKKSWQTLSSVVK